MNEQLVVKNFGPIKDATVDFKRVTVFIGPTGGGKSTLAKLAAVFRQFPKLGLDEANREFLDFYQIGSFVGPESEASWGFAGLHMMLKEFKLVLDENFHSRLEEEMVIAHRKLAARGSFPSLQELTAGASSNIDDGVAATYKGIIGQVVRAAAKVLMPSAVLCYAPAERVYLPSITNSLAALMRDNFNLPKTLLDFINQFITSRYEIKTLPVEFLHIGYELRGDADMITDQRNSVVLPLNETASGIQSVTPLMVLLEHLSRNTEQAQSFIIEEPELNLYPTAQQGLLNWLVEKCTKGDNDLTITTHSPYLLAHLNTLLFAYQVAESHPERAEEVARIVPRASWLNPKEFAAYHVEGQRENGVHSIVNPETGLISYNGLDALASAEATEFEKLLDINAGLEVE